MSHLSYELAKALTEDRIARAMADAGRPRPELRRELPSRGPDEEADVIEVVFGTHCTPDTIGA